MQKKEKDARRKLRYDPNDGLLPEIRRVCGYPHHIEEEASSSRGSGKKKKHVEEEWKWPEAQICALCSIGGDILCCEKCPASFHLACIGYEATDIPDDSFYCNRCKSLPSDVQLFPPEKCSSSVNPKDRIETEVQRNWETVTYQYKRLKKEEECQKANDGNSNCSPSLIEELKNCFPDKCFLKALGMANPMDYTLPFEYNDERDIQPNDSMEEKREPINGELCAECGLADDWSPMLNCDFCDLIWHQKCVHPALISIPRLTYWRCPRHTESLIDSIFEGEEITKDEKKRLYEKYENVDISFKTFESFCQATESLRLVPHIRDTSLLGNVYYTPDNSKKPTVTASSLVLRNISSRKGGRGKKNKEESRFFNDVFSVAGITDRTELTMPKNRQRTSCSNDLVLADKDLDELDERRSQKFTEEELIMSIMPFNETTRAEFLTQKLLGTDIEMSSTFLNRHVSMIARSQTFYNCSSEKELTRLMRQDLDPVETVRGSGTQSVCNTQEKTYRKKFKADVELLIQMLGVGNDHSDRKLNSIQAEAFYRRNAPPPSAQNVLNPRTLRECPMNSQKEAQDVSHVYKYHPNPENLEEFILIGYDIFFESAEERDSYYASSMTPWSKEPMAALTAKWAEEERAARIKSETPTLDVPGTSNAGIELVGNTTDQSREQSASIERESSSVKSNSSEEPKSPTPAKSPSLEPKSPTVEPKDLTPAQSPKVEAQSSTPVMPIEEIKVEDPEIDGVDEFVRERREETATPSIHLDLENSPDFSPPESPTAVIDRLALVDFKGLKMQEDYPKAESVCEAEGGFGEPDDTYLHGFRRFKSLNDLVDRPFWPAVQRSLQAAVRRIALVETEHNYSSLYPPFYSEIEEAEDVIEAVRPESADDRIDNDDRESSCSTDVASISTQGVPYDNFVEPQRKRGRPLGSKNRKEGDPTPKRKKSSAGSTSSTRGRGRSGRPRGSRGRGARSVTSVDGEGPSRRQSQTLSSDAPESPESGAIPQKIRDEVEEAKNRVRKLMVMRAAEESIKAYFDTRDDILLNWTPEQQQALREKNLAGRLNSLIPFDPRYFLPSQQILARIDISDQYLPIAIQRCLTKFGTARDCHVLLDKYTENICFALSEYHCDIVREYHTNTFYLSVLGTHTVIVNGVVVRRPQLSRMEASERLRTNTTSSFTPCNFKCNCERYSDQLVAHQENRGESIKSGIIKLEDGDRVRVGCATFTFKRV